MILNRRTRFIKKSRMNGLSNPTKIFARQIYLLAKVDDDTIKHLSGENTRLERLAKCWEDKYYNRYATEWDVRFHNTTRLFKCISHCLMIPVALMWCLPVLYLMILLFGLLKDGPLYEYKDFILQPICNAVEWIYDEGPCYGLEILHWFYTIYAYLMYFLYHLLEINC